ncbi:hybrid sensor histidine kinase/response regulator [Desulfoplanes sp.]
MPDDRSTQHAKIPDPQTISLRSRAEKIANESREDISRLTMTEIREMVHELKVHQIELEMQNENLQAARQEVVQTRDQYAELYDNAPVGYMSSDTFGVISRVNLTLATMLGVDKGQLCGTTLSPWCDDRDAYYLHCRNLLKGTGPSKIDILLTRSDGSKMYVAVQSTLHREDTGQKPEIRSVLADITQRKHLEKQLEHARKMESLGTLVGGIAHEFNNMLSIIMGNNEIASMHVTEGNPAQQYIKEVHTACLRARDMVQQLLIFGGTGDSTDSNPLNVTEAVRESMRLLRSSFPKTITIIENYCCENLLISSNPTRISQLLINICSNAVDAMPDTGGSITVELGTAHCSGQTNAIPPSPGAPLDDCVKLEISDTGSGMSQKTLARVFDPYFTTKEIGKGTGLGLSVVHGIVESHGGSITVASTPGKGTVFTIYLPLLQESELPKKERADELLEGTETILYAEDDPTVRKIGRLLMESLGYTVHAYADPRGALDTFVRDPLAFDLLVTDMIMPHLTGVQLAEKILSIRPKMPVILCTGYSEKISEPEALAAGITAFAMKPLTRNDFGLAIEKTLKGSRTRG